MSDEQCKVDGVVLDELRLWDTPTLANAVETFRLRPANSGFADHTIGAIFPDLGVLVGFAATATIRSASPWYDEDAKQAAYVELSQHIESLPKPCVLVVEDLDVPRPAGCLWGEVNSTIFQRMGCDGVVTNGLVRDLPEVRALGFHYFAAGVGVSHSYVRVESVGIPVRVGGLTVHPGQLLHGDRHGVLEIPRTIAAELPGAAGRVVERERRLLDWVRSPAFSVAELRSRRIAH